jgi:N-acetylmuramoyl-L-alanine amidase
MPLKRAKAKKRTSHVAGTLLKRMKKMLQPNRIAKAVGVFILMVLSSSFYPIIPGEFGVKTVVIDAGHGGKDPGAIGVDGIREKEVVLDIALKVGEQIKAEHPDIKLIYTRDKDFFVKLEERALHANKATADIFISIHADAAGSPAAHGTETFALGLHRTDANLETAKRENSSILLEDNYEVAYGGFDPSSDESYIAISLQQSAFLEQSLNIAAKVQSEFESIGRKNRGVKQAGFLVLYKTTMPSILIETGFITNTQEGRFMAKPENRTVIAGGIAKAFTQYKLEVERNIQAMRKAPRATPVAENTPAPVVVFKVQIGSSREPVPLKPANFKGLENVEELQTDNAYKYTIGNERSFEEGLHLQREVRSKGYKDAFLIAIHLGKRITIAEALDILKNSNP